MPKSRSDLERAIFGERALDRLMREDSLAIIKRDLGMSLGQPDIVSLMAAGRASMIEPETIRAASTALQTFRDLAKPYGGVAEMARSFADQQRQFTGVIEAMGGIHEFDRMRAEHWAAALQAPSAVEMAALMPNYASIAADIALAKDRASGIRAIGGLTSVSTLHSALGLSDDMRAAIDGTSLKMSILAGISDVRGVGTSAYDEAVRGLLGDWRSRPDLPVSFWRDRRVRERHYRRAEVDPGLIAAPPLVAVEILVESGLAAGGSDEQGAVALFAFGGVSVSIRSTDAQIDAYRGVLAFERRMRDFVASKLEAHGGPNWFKQRVDQTVFNKAKAIREAALKSGERPSPLINYTELGELKEIVLRTNNWTEVFEAVFINRLRFEHDMMTLMAVRRPTAHARVVDSTQMLEALLVMKRLDDRMVDDGAWKIAASSDT